MGVSGTLRVVRERSSWKDRARNYGVVIDGERAGTVANGGSFEAHVAPGAHELQLRIDWSGSPEQPFAIEEGETVLFTCRASPMRPLRMWRSLLSRTRYIELERTP